MGPFKCPDCGVWWAGFEHRCAPTPTLTITGGNVVINDTVVCTCPKPIDWSKVYVGDPIPCPLHGGQWSSTYTVMS